MEPLSSLLLLFIAIQLFNVVISLTLWIKSKEPLSQTLFYFWLAGLVTMVLQMLEGRDPYRIALLFSSTTLAHAIMAYLIGQVVGFRLPWIKCALLLTCAYILTPILHFLEYPFYIYSLPIVAATAFPLIYVLIKSTLHYRAGLTFFTRVLLVLIGLYLIDLSTYPFSRLDPSMAYMGYSFALFFVVAYSITLYSLIMEQAILKKTRALAELEQTQDRLIERERKAVIGEMSAGIIHEVKNQLHFTSLLEPLMDELPEGASEEIKELAGYIYDGQARTLDLLDEIMGLAKNTDSSYELEKYCLTKVIKNAIEIAKMDLDVKNKTIEFKSNFSGEVLMNRNKIIQVLLNLLRNAAHAIEKVESGKITVSVDDDHNGAIVSVADNGTGIETDKVDQIWEPFFSTKGKKGTGVGLDICKRIIEGHNGQIECRSEAGKGSKFSIYLPAVKH